MLGSGYNKATIDYPLVFGYAFLVVLGLMMIHSAGRPPDGYEEDLAGMLLTPVGKQFIWFIISIGAWFIINHFADRQLWVVGAYPIYAITLILLILVALVGKEIGKNNSGVITDERVETHCEMIPVKWEEEQVVGVIAVDDLHGRGRPGLVDQFTDGNAKGLGYPESDGQGGIGTAALDLAEHGTADSRGACELLQRHSLLLSQLADALAEQPAGGVTHACNRMRCGS